MSEAEGGVLITDQRGWQGAVNDPSWVGQVNWMEVLVSKHEDDVLWLN